MNLREQTPWWRRAARRMCQRLFQLAENNGDPRLTHNGELWLLRELLGAHADSGAQRAFVAFDVGANVGDYTKRLLEGAKAAKVAIEVHAFEPSPANVEVLRRDFGSTAGVTISAVALSDRAGEAALFAGRSGSSQASLVARPTLPNDPAETIQVVLVRLDDYLSATGIAHIDLLKLDVEGSELSVLRGLGEKLQPSVIDVIQFEYGGTTADAGASLKAIHDLLVACGYVVAKLFPTALEVREFRPWMENYAYANFVAVGARWRSRGKS
jgi:FkbM family methyltransferase